MGVLGAFLKPVPAGKTKEVRIERFCDENGEVIPVIVKAIKPAESERLVQICTENGVLNNARYSKKMIVACMVQPNLKATELCEYYGVLDPGDAVNEMFTIGEKNRIMDAILEVNDLKDRKSVV